MDFFATMMPVQPAVRSAIGTGGRALPRLGRLFYSRYPNAPDSKYVLPLSCFAAVGVGPFFSDATTQIPLNIAEILAVPGINEYHLLASLTKGVAVYDPYTTPDATLAKVHRYFGGTLDVRPTVLFNGMDFTGGTFTGGPTYVADNLGVLRQSLGNEPAIQGVVRAITVAEGAVLGSGLNPYPSEGGTWNPGGTTVPTVNASDTFSGLACKSVAFPVLGSGGYAVSRATGASFAVVAGNRYSSSYKIALSRALVGSETIRVYFTGAGGVGSVDLNSSNLTTWNTVTGPEGVIVTSGNDNLAVSSGAAGYATPITIYVREASCKQVIPQYLDTGLLSDNIQTRTGNEDFTSYTDAEVFKDYSNDDPLLAPRYLNEPARTKYSLQSATPATHTTGSVPVGTYCLWCEGGTSVTASAGTAIGTFGAATPSAPATITITTAGTVVLTVAGAVTWVQFEIGAFPTSRIYTTTASLVRAATVLSYPTAGKIRPNNMAFLMTVVPRATGQSSVYLFGCYTDASNYVAVIADPTVITYRKCTAGVSTDATVALTHSKDVPIQVIRVGSAQAGMQVAVRWYTGGAWSAWTDGEAVTTAAAKANAVIGSTWQPGQLNSLGQFTGNISKLNTRLIPDGLTDPLAWAKKEFGV